MQKYIISKGSNRARDNKREESNSLDLKGSDKMLKRIYYTNYNMVLNGDYHLTSFRKTKHFNQNLCFLTISSKQ